MKVFNKTFNSKFEEEKTKIFFFNSHTSQKNFVQIFKFWLQFIVENYVIIKNHFGHLGFLYKIKGFHFIFLENFFRVKSSY